MYLGLSYGEKIWPSYRAFIIDFSNDIYVGKGVTLAMKQGLTLSPQFGLPDL